MRISDWSSDVCSSDLGGYGVGFANLAKLRLGFLTGFGLSRHDIGLDPNLNETLGDHEPDSTSPSGNEGGFSFKIEQFSSVNCNSFLDYFVKYFARSEERRVGKECVSTCSSRCSRNH